MNNKKLRILFTSLLVICFFALPYYSVGQSGNHWSRNFNEESSLISGAVVGGDARAASIFYNPAGISEIEQSNLSVNASLFSFDIFNASNAWGNDIEFFTTRFVVVPRFVSYMLKPQKKRNWSLEFAFLNNENYQLEDFSSVDKEMDILSSNPGKDRYNAFYSYNNKYRDDWIGVGGAYKINPDLYFGISMFASFRTLSYSYMVDIEAGPLNYSSYTPDDSYYTAQYKEQEFVKFNNYRLLWKLGLIYKLENVSLGINISTPSVGLYSDGKRAARKKSQSNIYDPTTNMRVTDYLIADFAEKQDITSAYKSPLSIALGATWKNHDQTRVVYSTIEYFAGIKPYRMVDAQENYEIINGDPLIVGLYDEWLSFVWGAKPILNAAFGYRWTKNKITTVMGGIRTDFNYRKGLDYHPLLESRTLKSFRLNKYHFNGGITTKVKGQDLMAGIQYTFGIDQNQKQFVNLNEAIEYNADNGTALQGVKQNNMDAVLHSISIYFGATFNFSRKEN